MVDFQDLLTQQECEKLIETVSASEAFDVLSKQFALRQRYASGPLWQLAHNKKERGSLGYICNTLHDLVFRSDTRTRVEHRWINADKMQKELDEKGVKVDLTPLYDAIATYNPETEFVQWVFVIPAGRYSVSVIHRDAAKHAVVPPGYKASRICRMATCANCGKHKTQSGIKMKYCARCRITAYCSSECQKSDWSQHKKVCVDNSQR